MIASPDMSPTTTITVLLVDDHPVVRKGIGQLITQEPGFHVVGEAESAAQALEMIKARKPDVVVLDLTLKGVSGLELIKEIRAANLPTHLLVVSMHDERVYAERCLRLGANGYVMKEEAAETIVTAIRKVMDGGTYLSERLMSATVNRLVGGKSDQVAGGRGAMVASLSDRELEVFQLIGRGQTTRFIAEQLGLSVKTVEAHKANIKTKLGLRSAPDLSRLAVTWMQSQGA
jgi:DNA-binding NarL/FixJ family response regulator